MKKSRFREEQMVTILRCRRSRVGEWAVSDPCPRPHDAAPLAFETTVS